MISQCKTCQQPACSVDALLRTLDAGMAARLTLVLIADGANDALPGEEDETALLLSWARRQAFPVKVLSVNAADAQPDAFLDLLQATLDSIVHLEKSLGLPVEDRLADLVNAILDVPTDFALLVFGYSAIHSEAVHALLSRILDYQPPQLHLYLIVSAIPPLPCLPRMRVRRQLLEVCLI